MKQAKWSSPDTAGLAATQGALSAAQQRRSGPSAAPGVVALGSAWCVSGTGDAEGAGR